MDIHCTGCGAIIHEGAKFCQICGTEVKAAPEAYRYDGFAIASFVCVLMSIFLGPGVYFNNFLSGWFFRLSFLSLWLAIIFGIIALVRMVRRKNLKGIWMAIVGIIAGPLVIMIMITAIFIFSFMYAGAID